jgi:hypothetical protein
MSTKWRLIDTTAWAALGILAVSVGDTAIGWAAIGFAGGQLSGLIDGIVWPNREARQ